MLETPHVIVAAAIATKVANPALAIPLALGSHFILETVPHWNPHIHSEMKKFGKITDKSKKIIIADSLIALSAGLFIASLSLPDTFKTLTIVVACFVAVTPDLIEAPYYFLESKTDFIIKKWIPFKKSLQSDTNLLTGLATQLIIIIAAVWWIAS